jgi:hypothetical protein
VALPPPLQAAGDRRPAAVEDADGSTDEVQLACLSYGALEASSWRLRHLRRGVWVPPVLP